MDDEITLAEVIVLPEAIVTTPERCLMLLTVQPDAFADLGLVVFDECHLLHPRDAERSRRSVDAMLAVLNLTLIAPNADLLLLSAMMKNTDEIAQWIQEMTGRPCLTLSLAWKPTRQVRGTVVYPTSRINELDETLRSVRRNNPKSKNVPSAVARELRAQPFGFFSLLQTWASQDRDDYVLLPLLLDEHPLSTGRRSNGDWYLTPNGNQTSAFIAAAAAESGLKTLVFVQSIVLSEAAVRNFRQLLKVRRITFTENEAELHRLASEEMGGAQYCYLDLEADGTFAGGATGHHALLLREERLLHESLFKRADGVDVLFATSTLAQGMNLPSQIVIISGDSRFDPDGNRMAQLEAHELLNAAGRAGRAGESSQGFVLVVPSRVVEFDDQSNLINPHWMKLQTIFSQSDQCLEIDDPMIALLDRIHVGVIDDGMPAYLLSRLPPADDDGSDKTLRNLLSRSLAAFRARKRGDVEWLESRIGAAFVARNRAMPSEEENWLDKVSGTTGVPVDTLREIGELFADSTKFQSTEVAIETLIAWLNDNPSKLLELVRPENVERLFRSDYAALPTDLAKGQRALPVIADFLGRWLKGAPLNMIEACYPGGGDLNRCKNARHFVLRLVPDLAFVAGLPARLLTARAEKIGVEEPLPVVIATLGTAVREGCDSPECLAVRVISGGLVSRVAARARFEELKPFFQARQTTETFEQTIERAREAAAKFAFKDL